MIDQLTEKFINDRTYYLGNSKNKIWKSVRDKYCSINIISNNLVEYFYHIPNIGRKYPWIQSDRTVKPKTSK